MRVDDERTRKARLRENDSQRLSYEAAQDLGDEVEEALLNHNFGDVVMDEMNRILRFERTPMPCICLFFSSGMLLAIMASLAIGILSLYFSVSVLSTTHLVSPIFCLVLRLSVLTDSLLGISFGDCL